MIPERHLACRSGKNNAQGEGKIVATMQRRAKNAAAGRLTMP
jgi:hypothetical protein